MVIQKEEIIKVIDYLIYNKKVKMYSFGYVNTAISNVLQEINKIEMIEKSKQEIASTIEKMEQMREEVKGKDESTQRNQRKLNRIGVQSGFREKFNFDMFEGNR